MRIVFDDTDAAIELPDCPQLMATLRGAAVDWRFRIDTSDAEPAAVVRRAADGDGYEILGLADDPIRATAVNAACSVVVDAIRSYIDRHPSRLCLHCGSVVLGGRLVVFPNRYHAGKSTLVSRLAADGHTVFGDDVLPLSDDDRDGIALGIAPRLRLPLPEHASAAFRRFVEDHATAQDHRYCYLKPPGFARRDTTAPLGAVVILDRREDGPATLGEASRSAALRALITQNFARAAPAGDLLARMHRLMDRLPRFTLRYSDLDEAAALIAETFATWPPRPAAGAAPAGPPASLPDDGATQPPPKRSQTVISPATRLRQSPSVELRAVDGEIFLADAGGFAIHHLNPVGAGLWNLLAEPVSREDAVAVLYGAFPEAGRERISEDVAALFDSLLAEGFVVVADPDQAVR